MVTAFIDCRKLFIPLYLCCTAGEYAVAVGVEAGRGGDEIARPVQRLVGGGGRGKETVAGRRGGGGERGRGRGRGTTRGEAECGKGPGPPGECALNRSCGDAD